MTSESLRFWKKTIFWKNMEKTFAMFGGPTTAGLHALNAQDVWVWMAGLSATAGALLAIWMVDHDEDGVVDLFE